jgi:putative acetyltransferase
MDVRHWAALLSSDKTRSSKRSMPTTVSIEPMTIDCYEEVIAFWRAVEGIGMNDADERGCLKAYLARNPDMSFVAKARGRIIGTALCGHDGRRGYLNHLAVSEPHRNMGIGRRLTDHCLESLKKTGINKCHLFVYRSNTEGKRFWEGLGWTPRSDMQVVSKTL